MERLKRAVILANGAFPRKGSEARRILETAAIVVACDGAADSYRRHYRRAPDYVVGDLDSLKGAAAGAVKIDEQETNDLAKAIRFCRERGFAIAAIVGATGKREDHTLGNIFRAMEAGIEVVTDEGRFLPIAAGKALRLRLKKGAPVSVFATDPQTKMTSQGLEWPLDGVRFANLYCATLNRASAAKVEITSDHSAFVYSEK